MKYVILSSPRIVAAMGFFTTATHIRDHKDVLALVCAVVSAVLWSFADHIERQNIVENV